MRARHRYHSNPPIIFTALHPGKAREPYELQDESLENYDFEDIAAPNTKSTKLSSGHNRNPKDISKSTIDTESQVFAESSAFAKPLLNTFTGNGYEAKVSKHDRNATVPDHGNSSANIYHQYQEVGTTVKPIVVTTVSSTTTARRGTTTYHQSLNSESNFRQQRKHSPSNQFITYTTPNSIGNAETKSTASPRRRPSTYTTARKIENSRTTPFYTPTVPSIVVRPSPAFSFPPSISADLNQQNFPSTESTQSVPEHAVEMIKTLRDLNLNTVALPQVDSNENKEFASGQRPGLVIPPSSGPDTLHSLALYFATAVDNLVMNPETTTAFEKSLYIQPGNVTKLSSSLVSNSTVEKYKQLFSIDQDRPANDLRSLTNSDDSPLPSDDNDLETQHSSNPVLAAAGTPQIRELAQVFTHALSAYLHDPNTFRRVLSEIRPTEPPPSANDIGESNIGTRYGRTDDFNKGTGPTYLPTQYTQTYGTTSPSVVPQQSTTEELEVLDFSDVTVSTSKRDSFFTTTSTPSTSTTEIPEWLTTTEYSTTAATKSGVSLKQTLKEADRVPASRYLTEGLANSANEYEAKVSRPTTETNNPVAMEINGGLVVSTSIPYFHDDSFEHLQRNTSFEDTNYFPINSIDQQTNFSSSPYGEGVKPFNSTPIHSIYPTADDQNILPLSWNNGFAEENSYTATTTEYPSILSFELLPPASINDKGFVLPTSEILPPNLDENDLQRAQSQSIVSSNANLIARQQKSNSFTNRIVEATTTVRPPTTDYLTTTEDYSAATDTVNGHFITHGYATSTEPPQRRSTIPDTGKFSPNPWSTLAYTVFLDPLTINDGLMGPKNLKTVTPSPNTYLPRSTQTYADVKSASTEATPTRYSLRTDTTASSSRKAKTLEPQANEYMDVMQKKATAMFGGLNDTSAHHLLNVMKKANKNKTVRKLILLLIQTCDNTDDDTSIEESRTSLLNTLIGMDGRLDDDSELQVIQSNGHHHRRGGKSVARQEIYAPTTPSVPSSSTEIPITTYRRPIPYAAAASSDQFVAVNPSNYDVQQSTENYADNSTPSDYSLSTTTDFYTESTTTTAAGTSSAELLTTTEYTTSTTTDVPTTITTTTTTTTTAPPPVPLINNKRQRSQQSRRVVKDLDDLLGQHSHAYNTDTQNRAHKHSDTRALDLLKSLYSLAGKFGKR